MSTSEGAVSARRSPRKRTAVSRYSASEEQKERPAKRARVPKSTKPKMTTEKEKTKIDESKVDRRPNAQSQSAFLNLPAEIVDMILGDHVLTAREHLALSGTCTVLRLGYNEDVWKTMTGTVIKYDTLVQQHRQATHFERGLLFDPCSAQAARSLAQTDPGAVPYSDSATGPRARMWTTALSRVDSPEAGGDFTKRKCLKAKSKSAKGYHRTGGCGCMRLMGTNHANVVSAVNRLSVRWDEVERSYRALSSLVPHTKFTSVRLPLPLKPKWTPRRFGPRHQRQEFGPPLYCLATVDAAILKKARGVLRAGKVLKDKKREEVFWERWRGSHRRGSVEV